MPTLQELRDKRANAWAQAQDFRDRAAAGEEMSAEDEASWARALDEVDSLGEQISNRERDERLSARFAEIDTDTEVTGGNRDANASGEDPELREAFGDYLRNGLNGMSVEHRSVLEQRAQTSTTGSSGGYTVPQGFWAKVTETLKFYANVTEVAEVVTTDAGNKLPWPTNNDTTNTGRLLGENTQVTETALSFGQAELDAYTFSSDLVLVPLQLLQDSGVDFEGFVARKLGQRLGRVENSYFTTGSGSSEPQGYVTGATTGKTTAGATAITYDEIVDLIHSVDVAYRQNARFAMHDLILAYVRKIRDDSGGSGLGRPIWEPSVQAGEPDRLLGYPYFVNNFMASTVATTNKTMAFGDFQSGFAIRKVTGGQLMVLRERYADYLQVGYFGFERCDSVVQDSSAIKLMVQA